MKRTKNIGVWIVLLMLITAQAKADGGMWLPLLLKKLNEKEMQDMGMKLSAEDIYSVNKSSLKDAVVIFGGGCTGEVISSDGLLLTNHHCGYGQIQSHSSVENDYLSDGFWAKSAKEELSNPGLTVTFIVRMEDVTDKILAGTEKAANEADRQTIISENIAKTGEEATKGTHYEAVIKPFFYGNEYYMYITEKYKDVRLVGAPPSSIGKYGGDTDNWVWPRHTGDFSLFRIYTAPDGSPAEYSEENIPLNPKYFFPISLKNKKQNDFTMVFGFPGRTEEYLPSYAVDMVMNLKDPLRVALRDTRLKIMAEEMAKSREVNIQYASKYARVSNGYKKWKGEIWGLERTNALEKKRKSEAEFTKRLQKDKALKKKYGKLLSNYEKLYKEAAPLTEEFYYYYEAPNAIELFKMAANFDNLVGLLQKKERDENAVEEELKLLKSKAQTFYKDYYAPLDRRIAKAMLSAYSEGVSKTDRPTVYKNIQEEFGGNTDKFTDFLYDNSIFASEEKLNKFLASPDYETLAGDPAYIASGSFRIHYALNVYPKFNAKNDEIAGLHRSYMAGLREVFKEKTFYPDANFTLRVAYGKVEGYEPRDAVNYGFYTTLDGVMEKYDPNHPDFVLPEKLIALHDKKDYGKYAQDGELWVCFAASNHTTGGNSGSPVIDAEGNLIGINFDRNWEGTMSDINYDVTQCRNITCDIRYVLFIIDKFAGASYLLKNMKIVN